MRTKKPTRYRCIENTRTIWKNESGANQKSKTCNNSCALATATKNAHPIHRMQKRDEASLQSCVCVFRQHAIVVYIILQHKCIIHRWSRKTITEITATRTHVDAAALFRSVCPLFLSAPPSIALLFYFCLRVQLSVFFCSFFYNVSLLIFLLYESCFDYLHKMKGVRKRRTHNIIELALFSCKCTYTQMHG